MGNTLLSTISSPCSCHSNINSSSRRKVSLLFHDGTTRLIAGKHLAGEIMFEFPDMMVCPTNSFYLGCPIPILSIDDQLMPGLTYLVLPIDCFSSTANLTPSSIAALASSPKKTPINFADKPFEYLKGSNGKVLIKVSPEFLTRVLVSPPRDEITSSSHRDQDVEDLRGLCSTPELKKHYEQLVGNGKDRNVWSPKLETISEYNHNVVRFSPSRFLGFQSKKQIDS